MIEVSSRVTVADKQLFSNSSVMVDGQVVDIKGNSATVQLDGEEFPRVFDISQVKTSAEVYGADLVSPYDNQVVDAIRRR